MQASAPKQSRASPAHIIPYKSSKAAENLVGASFAVRLKEKGWKANCSCPGLRLTNYNKDLGMGEKPE